MAARTKKKNDEVQMGSCAYCHQDGVVTPDHVVPQCLFPRPLPDNIPIVPACRPCNHRKKSADDNLLRDIVVSDIDTHEHPIAHALWEKVRRSAEKGHSTFAQHAQSAIPVERRTPGGLYLPLAYAVDLPPKRVNGIFARIVRGLHLFYTGEHVPDSAKYAVYRVESRMRAASGLKALLDGGGIEKLVGDGDVFRCVYLRPEDQPEASSWLLTFYENLTVSVAVNYHLLGMGDPPCPIRRVG